MKLSGWRGRSVLYVLCSLLVCLVSCGGGSSGSPTDPGLPEVDEAEVEFFSFQLVNEAREEHGVRTLIWDPVLADVARRHSRRMRDAGFFSHRDPNGQTFADRLRTAGVHVSAAGENLARVEGSGSPASTAHRAFLENPAHRDNLLDRRFTHAGVGVARRGGTFWVTQVFVRK